VFRLSDQLCPEQARQWRQYLRRSAADAMLFISFTAFIVVGGKQ
jgi:hypothetical protein